MTSLAHVRTIRDMKGLEAGYHTACKALEQAEKTLNDMWESRFFERRTLEDGTKKLWPVTAQHISHYYDLLDAGSEPSEFLYCDVDGMLYPVTVGGVSCYQDSNPGQVYGESDLVANNKVVGQVYYTDH